MANSLRTAAALVLLSAGACQCGDDPGLVRVAPSIELEVEAIDFGEVPVGATKRVLLRVDNRGTADLVVISATTDAPFGADLLDATIMAGATGLIDVWFRPTNEEPQTANLLIESNDEQKPMLSVVLTGSAVDGVLTIQPSAVDFGQTTVGVGKRVELLLSNFGLETVEGRTTAEFFDRPEHFSMTTLSDFTSNGRFSVPGRGEAVLDLDYRPLELGPDAGRLVFEVCGERCGIEVPVQGVGSEAAVRLDPPVLDFGVMGIGDTKTLQIDVDNIGNGPLDVTEALGTSSAILLVTSTRPLPFTIEAGGSLTLTVELTTTAAGLVDGAVTVRTTDPLVPEARAMILAEGQGPLFSVQPEAITFGAQRTMSTSHRPLLLLNSGSTIVQVQTITLGGDPEFQLGPVPGLPATLAAGESLIVDVTFTPTQLAMFSANVVIESDDPVRSRVEVPVTGALTDQLCELDTRPNNVNFGVVPPTFTRLGSTTLTNIGSDVCTITSGSFRAPVDPTIRLLNAPWPITLNPGDAFVLDFEFAPVALIESKANLTMMTTDPVYPERHVVLAGTGLGYIDVFTDPTSVDFGTTRPMCALPARNVTLYNAGNVDVMVSRVILTSSTSEFSFTSLTPPPFLLRAGSSERYAVRYEPQDIGVDQGALEIQLDGLAFPLIVPLVGEGSQIARTEDTFEQRKADKVDVLFVIDDSCSMADDQMQLASNFMSFINSATVRQVDFQIGITTTTLSPVPGDFVGPILTSRTPQLETAFSLQANVGAGGSGFERGLEAMSAALTQAQRGLGFNAGFLRADAGRAVIIVSDEDDQSASAPATYFNDLRRQSPNGYVTAVVSGGAMGCRSNGQIAAPAPNYETFVTLTGGQTELICNSWASTLTSIGNATFGLGSTFILAGPADTAMGIEVYVDGVQVTQGWTYDSASNAVVFATPPAEGAEIRVVYTPRC